MELPVTDVHRVHQQRSTLQQHVGESAGGGAQVHADAARDQQPEVIERLFQLAAPAGHVGQLLFHPQLHGGIEDLAGLVYPMISRDHAARQDQRLRPGPRLGEPALLHEHVRPHLHRRCSGVAGAAGPISWAIRESSRSMSIGLLK